MQLLQKAFRAVRSRRAARTRSALKSRPLRYEPLEVRQVMATMPFTVINNSEINSNGELAYQDNQVSIAIYGQDFLPAANYYYFNQNGAAFPTTSAPNSIVPTFHLSDLVKTGDHTYLINLPEELGAGSQYGIQAARMYFSMDGGDPLVLTVNGDGSVNNPTPNASYFDFIEFTVNAPNNPVGNLNIDTTNVDQFGVPITIKVDPTSGSDQTVGAAETREKIIDAFKTFTSDANDPYAICLWPTGSGDYGSYRILNPSGLFDEVNPGIQPIQVKTTLQDNISATDTVINV